MITIGQILNIPPSAVSPCLHDCLENAEVVGFAESSVGQGKVAILKTSKPWRAAPGWPEHTTVGVRVSVLEAHQ